MTAEAVPAVEGMDAARLEAVIAAFGPARVAFEALVGELAADEADLLTAARLEDRIANAGREVMRQLLQGHMDLRSICEPRRKEMTGPTGGPGVTSSPDTPGCCSRCSERCASSGSPTGRSPRRICIRWTRAELAGRAVRAWAAAAGRPGGGARLVRRRAGAIIRACGTRIGKRQVEQLTVRTAVDIEAFYRAANPIACSRDTVLVVSVDGKGIVMRPEALREHTAKANEAKEAAGGNKLATRLSGGEKLGRKRMAMLGTVYDTEPAPRTADDIIAHAAGSGQDGRRRNPGPKAFNKWLTGSVTDNTADVVSAVFDQAEQRDPTHLRAWVVLVDGAKPQLDQIIAEAHVRGIEIHIIADLIHVLEYLWKAAWCFHQHGDPAAEAFVAVHAHTILAGNSEQTVADLRHAARTAELGTDKQDVINKVCGYLENKQPWLRYDQALARGWPIATGIIEGACRHLVKDRLDITGARWGLEGAEAVLKLRALMANGDFDTYFAWHLRREFHRVHQARYQDKLSLAA